MYLSKAISFSGKVLILLPPVEYFLGLSKKYDAHAGIAQFFFFVHFNLMNGGSTIWLPLGSLYTRSIIIYFICCIPVPHFQFQSRSSFCVPDRFFNLRKSNTWATQLLVMFKLSIDKNSAGQLTCYIKMVDCTRI